MKVTERRTWSLLPLTNTSKVHLSVEQSLTECRLNAGRSHTTKDARKITTNWVGWKKINESGLDLCTWVGVVTDERSPHFGNSIHQLGNLLGQIRSFRGSEESTEARFQQEEYRDDHKYCCSPFCTPQPKMLFAGVWRGWVPNSGFNRQIWGEEWDWLHRDSPKGLDCSLGCIQGCAQERACILHRNLIVKECEGWVGLIIATSQQVSLHPYKFWKYSGTSRLLT